MDNNKGYIYISRSDGWFSINKSNIGEKLIKIEKCDDIISRYIECVSNNPAPILFYKIFEMESQLINEVEKKIYKYVSFYNYNDTKSFYYEKCKDMVEELLNDNKINYRIISESEFKKLKRERLIINECVNNNWTGIEWTNEEGAINKQVDSIIQLKDYHHNTLNTLVDNSNKLNLQLKNGIDKEIISLILSLELNVRTILICVSSDEMANKWEKECKNILPNYTTNSLSDLDNKMQISYKNIVITTNDSISKLNAIGARFDMIIFDNINNNSSSNDSLDKLKTHSRVCLTLLDGMGMGMEVNVPNTIDRCFGSIKSYLKRNTKDLIL